MPFDPLLAAGGCASAAVGYVAGRVEQLVTRRRARLLPPTEDHRDSSERTAAGAHAPLRQSSGEKSCGSLCTNNDATDGEELDLQDIFRELAECGLRQDGGSEPRRRREAQSRWESVVELPFSSEANQLLTNVLDWNFDVLRFAKLPDVVSRPLLVTAAHLLRKSAITSFPEEALLATGDTTTTPLAGLRDKLVSFIAEIERGYLNNPYHNSLHACDVMQTMNCFFETDFFRNSMMQIGNRLISLVSAAMHDVGHTGQNNAYHISLRSDLAIMYNDNSVLENMHVSSAFQLMKHKPETNWLDVFSKAFDMPGQGKPLNLQAHFRKYLIQMVLATDIAKHNDIVKRFVDNVKSKVVNSKFVDGSAQDLECFTLEVALHAADISNPTKVPSISIPWAGRVVEEFWAQGDLEKKTLGGVSMPMFDRDRKDVPQSQIGFIDFIVIGLYKPLSDVIPEFVQHVQQLEKNKAFWKEQKDRGVKLLPPVEDWPA